jgi:hypothetical protein
MMRLAYLSGLAIKPKTRVPREARNPLDGDIDRSLGLFLPEDKG